MNKVRFKLDLYKKHFVDHGYAFDLDIIVWLNKNIGEGSSDVLYTNDVDTIRVGRKSWQLVFDMSVGENTGLWVVFHNSSDAVRFRLRLM